MFVNDIFKKKLNETVLNPRDPQGDYDAKRKVIHDLSLDPAVDQQAVQQRRLDLDKEAKAKGLKEQDVKEGGPFSSTEPKKPRKGSVADLAAQKRREQEKGRQPIEPRDQQVGAAKVVKEFLDDRNKDDDDGGDGRGRKSPKARARAQMLKMYGDGDITFRKTSNGGYFIQHEDDIGDTHSHQYDPQTGQVDFSSVTRSSYYGEGLNEFAPSGGGGGRWYSDDQLYEIIGEDWLEAFDVSGDQGNIDLRGERARLFLAQEAEAWLTDRGYRVNVLDVKDDGDELSWYIQGPLYRGLAEGSAQEKLYKRHQELRKKSGLPDPDYYKELKTTYDLPDDERHAKQKEIKQKYKVTNEDREQYIEELQRAGYEIVTEKRMTCPECGGAAYEDRMLAEKQDACYHKVKSRYKVWPSAYASGALVRCRKKGAKNWGNKSKK